MNIILTNLSNDLYDDSRFKLNESASKQSIAQIESYSFNDLKNTHFYRQHEHILKQPKGIGYWLWKPYIILESLQKISDGDIVVYSDCGIEIIADLNPLYDICSNHEPIMLFANSNFSNNTWTKRDCFVLMDCDSPFYWFGPHCDAAFSLWRKCPQSVAFLNEWIKYGSDERIITDLPNTSGKNNLPEFIDHRWDQSILSLLAQKYGVNLYRMPTQFGNHYKTINLRVPGEFNCVNQKERSQVEYYHIIPMYNSQYMQLLNHHRSKKVMDIPAKETFKKRRFGFLKSFKKMS